MRPSALLLLLPVLACGGATESPAVVTVPVTPLPPPPPPPPPPPEPTGLVVVSAPASVCEVSGAIGHSPLALAAIANGPSFGEVMEGSATMAFGEHDAFAEVRTTSWTVRGILSADDSRVRAARWISFGGVLYAGTSERLAVKAAHDGKLVLAAPDTPGFTLAVEARTTDAPCDSVSLDPDVNGVLHQAPPPAFMADRPEQPMILKRLKPIAVSSDVHGPAAGTIDDDEQPAGVTLLERRGSRARIRWGHLAGWIDAGLLSKAKPLSPKELALREATQFGMIGLLGTDAPAGHDGASSAPSAPSSLVCAADVRIVADVAGGARLVVGSIPAGRPVRVLERGPELSTVSIGAFTASAGVRLVVPSRDIAAGCTPGPDAPVDDGPRGPTTADITSQDDAIDALGGGSPPSLSSSDQRLLGLITGAPPWQSATGFGQGGLNAPSHGAAVTPAGPSLREGVVQVSGRLPPEVIMRIARQNFGRFRVCYQNGLASNPGLTGRVTAKFHIDASGAVTSTADAGSDLPDSAVVGCVVNGFSNLSFPQPEGGTVDVVYPILFFPGQPHPAKH
jgi:hypothetical protein